MVQIVSETSWGKRIIGSLFGILIGIALLIGSVILVFWNEGHGLHTAQSLQQAHEALIKVPDAPVDPNNNLRVVYLSGKATTEDMLDDKLFNVSVNAIQLNRDVKMYQWKEEKEEKTDSQYGGSERTTTTYSYRKVWSSSLIDSSSFKEGGHDNPPKFPVKSQTQYAENVTVGDFSLPTDLIEMISGDTTVALDKTDLPALSEKIHKPVIAQDDGLYAGANPDSPQIGDLTIHMKAVYPQDVSIIAQQTDTTLQAYMAPAGQSVLLLEMGHVSSDEMIHNAEVSNRILTWVLRGVSLLLMMIGFSLIMQPVVILADVIPFLGSIASFGTGLVAFVLGLGLWSVTTAIAWFAVRPLMSIGLIAVAAVLCYLLFSRKKQATAAK